jgi:hypothetical protein
MMYKMTVSGLAEGQTIQIDGLGEFHSGQYTISKEEAENFRTAQSSHNPKPPTLLQAFEKHPNIQVETIAVTKTDTKKDDEKKGGDN